MSGKELEFCAPKDSKAQQTLIALAGADGQDTEAIRDLLWLINAHPELIAHDGVFQHIGQILKSDLCQYQNLVWASGWKASIPAWRRFCDWVTLNANSLKKGHPELASLTKTGTSFKINPLIRQGAARHGIVTALRVVHQSAIGGNQTPKQKRYLQLQGHCMLAFIEARFRKSSRNLYESYCGREEFQKDALTPSDPVGLAIRTLANDQWNNLLEKLPNEPNTARFSEEFVELFNRKSIKALDGKAQLICDRLRLCFERLIKVRAGKRTGFKNRAGHNQSAGGGKIQHGFIDRSLAPGDPLIQAGLPPSDDPDIVVQTLPTASFFDLNEGESIQGLEADGIHPSEHREEIFQLYDPKAEAGTLQKLRYQQCALDMAAQHFPWDYSQLTAGEIQRLYREIDDRIERFQCGYGPKQRVEQQATFAAMLLTSLFLGQPLSQVRTIRRVDASTPENLSSLNQTNWGSETCAIFLPPEEPDAQKRLIAFAVPAKTPLLKLATNNTAQNQQRQSHLLLPAPAILASPLQMLLHRRGRQNEVSVFGFEEKTVSTLKSEFFASFAEKYPNHRITPEKIRRQLGEVLIHHTNELTAKWLITADDDGFDEPRMHYTRHDHDNLVAHYMRAATHLAAKAHRTWASGDLFPQAHEIRTLMAGCTVGCQFRVETSTLHKLVGALQRKLGIRQSDLRSDDIHRYHNAYTLYVWLLQSLTTTMRAIRSPDRMLNVKKGWNVQHRHLPAGLSDKDSDYEERARYVVIPRSLSIQLRHYQRHLASYLGLFVRQSEPPEGFVIWEKTGKSSGIQPLSPTWLGEALKIALYEALQESQDEDLKEEESVIPVNFHRAYLRSELIARGCPGEIIDAFMGHANRGELPFLRYSTFDYEKYRQQILEHLESILASLGFKVIASHLLPHRSRFTVADIHV